ncbi:hypothetical protein [Histidinibacterium lentulum]|uniref:FUSC family protein n=1 Tax=Histidinibacterium lentulum TaxID=2480588 RepID=A0A3N2R7Z5_9RHOB|nr:hypothetical protein [Histidinibacterium lentulum]ROU03557.1 hypothetical protein EAT49_04485 [Histidinibacterium lentulum]
MATPAGLLPWSIVGTIAGTAICVTLAAAALDPPLATAAAAGLAVGLGGTVMGGLVPAGVAAAVALAAIALGLAGLDPRLAALALAALAGWEAHRRGGRAAVYGILATVMLSVALRDGAGTLPALLVFAAAAAAGIAVAQARRLTGLAAPPPEDRRGGVQIALFLALGLMASLTLVGNAGEPRAVWILYTFVLRALSPVALLAERTLVYALGACLGAVAALALELLGPPGLWPTLAIASVAVLVGLRRAALLSPVPGALFTLATLLVVAPTPAHAVFRLEVILLVAAMVLALAEGLRRVLGPNRTAVQKLPD